MEKKARELFRDEVTQKKTEATIQSLGKVEAKVRV